jgi:fructokinase
LNTAATNGRFTVVGLGEAVFDLFPGRAVLGGATLNIAVHAHQLLAPHGGRGVVLSRVGEDELGSQLRAALAARGMTDAFVQRDGAAPTGTVRVFFRGNDPYYEIVRNTAWDALAFGEAEQRLAMGCDAVCFGTLAQRDTRARASVRAFLRAAPQAVRLFDVNLREDFFDAEILEASCSLASVVKLNEEELPVVARHLALPERGLAAQLETLRTRFNLRAVVLTRGARGTLWSDALGQTEAAGPRFEPAPGADNVGAGDACSAGLLVGLLRGLPPNQTVALANRLGAFVVSQPGATPELPAGVAGF